MIDVSKSLEEFGSITRLDWIGLDVVCIDSLKNDGVVVATVGGERGRPVWLVKIWPSTLASVMKTMSFLSFLSTCSGCSIVSGRGLACDVL